MIPAATQTLPLGAMWIWYQPPWAVASGVALAWLVLLLVWAALWWWRPGREFVAQAVRHGLLGPVLWATALPLVLFVLGLRWAPYRQLMQQLSPLQGEAAIMLVSAAVTLVLALIPVLLHLAFPRMTAIAYATAKEGLSQPLFWVLLSVGTFALVVFIWIPYYTFGEDIKMLKDQAMVLIMLLSVLLGVWNAGLTLSDEIEGKTAVTVLSKPIGRRTFILGKFTGLLFPVLLQFLLLSVVFLVVVSYKVLFEAGETGKMEASLPVIRTEMLSVLPGLALRMIECIILISIAVALSTRLQMLSTLVICFLIYGLGHLVPRIVQSDIGQFEIVQFMSQLLATILPVLEHFDVEAAITSETPIPWSYVGWAALYGMIYCLFAMLGAFAAFEDRDLA